MNKLSCLDDGREVLNGEDFMFEVENPKKLLIGKNCGELNLVILMPRQDKSGGENDNMKLGNMIAARIHDQQLAEKMSAKFGDTENIKRVKILCEIWDLDTNICHVGISDAIADTNSKKHGVLDILDVHPRKSCELGGRKILMISEFGLAKDVWPRQGCIILKN